MQFDYTAPTFHRFDFTGNPNFTRYPINVPGVKAGDVVIQEYDAIGNAPFLNKDTLWGIKPIVIDDDYITPAYNTYDDTMTVTIIVIRDHPVSP